MHPVLEQLALGGIVPVVVIENDALAEPLARALLDAGLSTMEITFRTKAAQQAMTKIGKGCPGMLMGAGTVLTVDQVKAARDAGARYIVSPGLNAKVVEYCLAQDIPVTPGVATPTEIEAAMELGLSIVKFFPAEANGGLDYLKAICAPYKQMKFIPTGGIDESNLLSYLKFPSVLACGGSWMVKQDLINAQNFEEVTRLTLQAIRTMLGLQLTHVGINTSGPEQASGAAALLSRLLQAPVKDGMSSIFVGPQFEFLKRKYLGAHGHLALGTHFIDRAIAYFQRQGIGIKEDTRNEKAGKLVSVYLDQEIEGFAIHLLQL